MRHAFTLIELLVVLTVISLLAALLLPAIGLVRDEANRTSCAQRMRMIGLGMHAHAHDNDGQLVWAKLRGWPGSNGYFDPIIGGGYIDGTNPDDSWSSVRGPAFNCPSGRVAQRGDFWYDYAPCVALLGTEEQATGTPRRTHVAELTRAADVGLLFEVIIGTPWWIPANESPADQYSGWTAQHRSTANVVYADGHVSTLRYRGEVNNDGLAVDATAWNVSIRNDPNDRTGDLIWSRSQLGLNPSK